MANKDPWVGISGREYNFRRSRGMAPWEPEERKTKVLNDLIEQLEAERNYWGLTGRHEGYRLLEHAEGYEKTDAMFRDVGDVLKLGRRAGKIPWEAVDDGRSEWSIVPTWETAEEFLERVPDWYDLDLLAGQTAIEVVVEASGMLSQTAAITRPYSIGVYTSSGTRTTSAIYRLAKRAFERVIKEDRETLILIIGDLDNDGTRAIDSTADDTQAFIADMMFGPGAPRLGSFSPLQFEIVALTGEQVETYDLHPGPEGKRIIPRTDYDGSAVQLEALDAADYEEILTNAIERHIDRDLFNARRALRDHRRAEIREWLTRER